MEVNSPLSTFGIGLARVARIAIDGNAGIRLKSLGIFAGQRVEVLCAGAIHIVKAAGGRVALGPELASGIFVERVDR